MGRRIRYKNLTVDTWQVLSEELLKTISTSRLLGVYRKTRKLLIYIERWKGSEDEAGVKILERYKEELNRREHVPRLIQNKSGKKKRAKN